MICNNNLNSQGKYSHTEKFPIQALSGKTVFPRLHLQPPLQNYTNPTSPQHHGQAMLILF